MPKKTEDLETSEAPETQWPPPPGSGKWGRRVPIKSFWRLLREYPDKAGLTVYLYRRWPVVDCNPRYIESNTLMTEKGILETHGSGEYLISISDSNRLRGSQTPYHAIFKLDDERFPPAPVPETVVLAHPNNKAFVERWRREGRLPKESGETRGEAMIDSTGGVEAVAGVAQEALRMVRERPAADGEGAAFDRALKLAALLVPKSDPVELATRIAGMAQGGGIADLVKILSESNARLMELAQARAAKPAENPFSQIEQVTGLLDKLGVKIGGGGSSGRGGRDWWEIVPETLNGINSLLGTLALLQTKGAAAVVVRPELPATTENPTMAGVVRPERLLAIGKRALARFQQGITGADFAHGLVTMEDDGEQVYAMLSLLGSEQILSALRQLPDWPQLAPREADLRAWLDDFIKYGLEDEGGISDATV